MREWMTGIHGQRRQHWKNFLLKIAIGPGSPLRRQLSDFPHVNSILGELRQQFVFPKRILRSHKLAHRLLDAVEQLRGTQPVRTNVACLAFNLLFDSGYPNLEKLIQIRAENREELNPLDERLRGILRFL